MSPAHEQQHCRKHAPRATRAAGHCENLRHLDAGNRHNGIVPLLTFLGFKTVLGLDTVVSQRGRDCNLVELPCARETWTGPLVRLPLCTEDDHADRRIVKQNMSEIDTFALIYRALCGIYRLNGD